MAEVERGECSGCGHPLAETTARESAGNWDVSSKTCYACMVIEAQVENDGEGGKRPRGRKYSVGRSVTGG